MDSPSRRTMRTRSLSRSSITRRRSFMYRRTRIRTSREIRSGCARTARTPRRTVPWPRAATSTWSFATTAGRWCGGSNSCRATACTAATFPRSHWNASGTTRLRPTRSTCATKGPTISSRSRSRSGPIRESRRTQRNTSVRKVSDFDVSFFPEGGYLIDGYDCCVAFKALGDDGGSVEVTGVVEERPRGGGRHASHASRRHGLSALHAPYGRTLLRRMHDGGRKDRTLRLACIGTISPACFACCIPNGTFTVMVQSGRPLPEGVAAARPLPRQSVLLPRVERRSSVADLQARQAAGRGAANSAAGQGGQRALRASGLQSGRRTLRRPTCRCGVR